MPCWTREESSAAWPLRIATPFPALRASRPSPSRCWRSFSPFRSAAVRLDLGSWGSDKEKPQAAEQKPTGTIQRTNKRQRRPGLRCARAARRSPNQLARPKKRWRNPTARLTLDPYNVQALYGRGLIYQADKHHEQAIADFTAANGLTPQRVEPLLARATSYLAIDKDKGSRFRSRRGGAGDPNSAQAWSARGGVPMSAWATRPRRSPPTANARSHSAPKTKPREAASARTGG